MPTKIVFVVGDRIERPTGRGTRRSPLSYRWTQGYNRVDVQGRLLFPAVTRREALQEAKTAGASAVFFDDLETARNYNKGK